MKQKCPITKAPKNAVQWVGHALDGNGFFHIPHAPFKGDTDKKTAKITVGGGVLSLEQLTEELQNASPVQALGSGTFAKMRMLSS